MDLLTYYLLLITVTASVLVIMYTIIIWVNFKGSKFNFVYLQAGLLLLNNALWLVYVFTGYQVAYKNGTSSAYIWTQAIAVGSTDLTFSVSHILLALKYR